MFLGSLIKRGLHKVLKPNETLKESFANPKFLLFRVSMQGCNVLQCFFHSFLSSFAMVCQQTDKCYVFGMFSLRFCYIFDMLCYVFGIFCYALLCFALVWYVLLCFAQ